MSDDRQGNLFDDDPVEHGLARNTDPDTSHEAAESIDVSRLELIVWNFLSDHPKSLTEEICWGVNMTWNSISPRLRPLCNKGMAREAGRRVASTGRRCIEWEAIIPEVDEALVPVGRRPPALVAKAAVDKIS